MTHSLISL